MPSKNPCSLTFFVVAVIATFAWVFYVCALSTPGDFVFGLPLPPKEDDKQGLFKVPRKDMPGVGGDSSDMGWLVAKYQALASKPAKSSSPSCMQSFTSSCGEKGVRLAQKMRVGPCIPVGVQR